MTIKKVGSGESDSSFESTILGLEEDLKRLPGAANRKKRVKEEEEGEMEGEEMMPPKLEPNYPDLKVLNTVFLIYGWSASNRSL
jgi:hypothetical protein